MSLVFNMCCPAFRFDILRATVAATISHTIKGIAKHEDKYLIALNDGSWNLYAAWVSRNKYFPPAKLNATGTYPAAGIAVSGKRVDIPITDKYGGAIYKSRIRVSDSLSNFVSGVAGFKVTAYTGARLNCAAISPGGYTFCAGKASTDTFVTRNAITDDISVGFTWQKLGENGDAIDMSICHGADGLDHAAILTDAGTVIISTIGTNGALSVEKSITSAANSKKLVILPGDSVSKYRCAYVQKTATGHRLVSRYGNGAEVISPDFAAQGCAIIGAGRIGKTAAIVYSDEQKNGRVYVNTDGVNGKSYPLDIADPAAMCLTDTGIAVIGKTGGNSEQYIVVEVNPT
nr:MAG TPA: hypothetical protein [Caudoviricetes sp.]